MTSDILTIIGGTIFGALIIRMIWGKIVWSDFVCAFIGSLVAHVAFAYTH